MKRSSVWALDSGISLFISVCKKVVTKKIEDENSDRTM
jgi:hypothetical protein